MDYTDRPMSFLSFWSINDRLDLKRLMSQLDELKEAGLHGVVFHPRYYPNDSPYLGGDYMDTLSRLILYAKSIGMKFWIYDENGWPSGIAGGEVIKRNPGLTRQWIVMKEEGEGICLNERFIHSFRLDRERILPEDSDRGKLFHIAIKNREGCKPLGARSLRAFHRTHP